MKILIALALPVLAFIPYSMVSPPRLGAAARGLLPALSCPPGSSPGAPVDGDRRAPSPFGERAVRERSKDWEVKNLETPGWRLLMSETFAIRSDVPLDDLRAAGVYLEEFLKAHRALLGGDVSDLRFSVHIFRDPHEFRCYAKFRGVPQADSFYDPSSAEVVVYMDPLKGRDALALALMHEFSHQYLHRVFDRTDPLWLAEGLAEYFRHYSLVRGKVTPGAVSDEHRARLRQAVQDGTLIPMRDLVARGREKFYGDGVMLAYAEAWALVRCLLELKREALDALVKGKPLASAVDVAELEQVWMKFLKE